MHNRPVIRLRVRPAALEQRFTRNEVGRIAGISRRQLDYWTRLGLLEPRPRWGERFYSFSDLVAIETIKQLSSRGIPVRRLRRVIDALSTQLRVAPGRLASLRLATRGRQVVVTPPGPDGQPVEPLTGQFLLQFDSEQLSDRVKEMSSRTAEEWFELGMACDTSPDTLQEAVNAYRRAAELAPDWVEAHINLGTALFQRRQMVEAREAYLHAAFLEPNHPLVQFNLGCVLEQLGDTDAAIERLQRAIQLAPHLADAHLNLALALEKRGKMEAARLHLSRYLQYEPRGPWADYARRVVHSRQFQAEAPPVQRRDHSKKVTPFRRR